MAKLSTILLISSVLAENQMGGVERSITFSISTPLSQLQKEVRAIRNKKR